MIPWQCSVYRLCIPIAVLLMLFSIEHFIFKTRHDETYSRLSNHFMPTYTDANRVKLESNLSSMYKSHKRFSNEIKHLYDGVVEKFMYPWLKIATQLANKSISINEVFPIFSTAHLLELQLISNGHFNRYTISRYVRDNRTRHWILRSGKPTLQFVPMPCPGLKSFNLTPDFLTDNKTKLFAHHGFWRLLQHLIDTIPNEDLPDHVDLFFVTDDYPWIDIDRQYHFPLLHSFISTMQQTLIPPPLFNFCRKVNKLDIPFMYLDQLVQKPIEPLVHKLLVFQNRTDDIFAVTLSDFKKRNTTAIWRGGTSGQSYTLDNWLVGQRSRLVQLSKMAPHLLDARFTTCLGCPLDLAQVMNRSLDQWINTPLVSSEIYFQRQFLVDLEGNGWSSRFYELMLTGALIFKLNHTDKCDEFWYDLLRPGIDFVPVAADLHDLFSKLIYYRAHPKESNEIANSGMRRVSFLLRADIWPRYAASIWRAVAALQTKPDSREEQQLVSLGLAAEPCSSMSSDYCSCKPL